MIYFQLLDNFVGEVYFRVSKHLHVPISEVIRGFYNHDLDIIMLMRRYGEEIKMEQDNIKKMKQKAHENKLKNKKRRMRY